MTEDGPRQISVSRDALRADLAEMELRLKMYMDMSLEKKANASLVDRIAVELSELRIQVIRKDDAEFQGWRHFDEGNFSKPTLLAIRQVITDEMQATKRSGWSTRERVLAIVTIVCLIATLFFTALYTIHSFQTPNTPAAVSK